MSIQRQLELLSESCTEALELKKSKISVISNRLQEQIEIAKSFEPSNIKTDDVISLYKEHQKEFLEGDRSWLGQCDNAVILDGLNVSYCFSSVEEIDPDLASIILYRVYRLIEVADILSDSDAKVIKNRSTTIKSMLDGDSTAGPAGIELGAIQNNLGGIIQNFMPMFEGLMNSNEFKQVLSKAVPKEVASNEPPDITSVIKNTMSVFESQEGKDLFNKITTILPIPKK